ncbi:MAG: sugar phosphate isomerase/epimerase family protein [Leadbetterella sp.]
MKIGISSFTYGWNVGVDFDMPSQVMTEVDLVNLCLQFGVDCLQIGDNLPLHTLDSDRLSNLKSLIQEHNLRLEIGAKHLTPENLQTYIDLCVYFKAPLLRFIIDGKDYEPNQEDVIQVIQAFLPQLIEHNIVLGIENHDRFKAVELAHIMKVIDHSHVGICLDCVNSIGAGEGLEHVASILAPYTVNLHIKDFKAQRLPHKMGFVVDGEIAGKGMTNLPWLVEKIKPFNRCQSAILEQWVPPDSEIECTCIKEKQWAEIGIKYVKSIIIS